MAKEKDDLSPVPTRLLKIQLDAACSEVVALQGRLDKLDEKGPEGRSWMESIEELIEGMDKSLGWLGGRLTKLEERDTANQENAKSQTDRLDTLESDPGNIFKRLSDLERNVFPPGRTGMDAFFPDPGSIIPVRLAAHGTPAWFLIGVGLTVGAFVGFLLGYLLGSGLL